MWKTPLAGPLAYPSCYTLFHSSATVCSASSKSNTKSKQQSPPKASGTEKAPKTKSVLSLQREPTRSSPTRIGPTNSSPSKTTFKKTTGIIQQSVGSQNAPPASSVVSARPSAPLGSTSSPSPSVSSYVSPITSALRPQTRVVSQSQKVAQDYIIHPGDNQVFTLPDGQRLSYAVYGSRSPKAHAIVYFHGTPGTRLEMHDYHNWGVQNDISLICPDRPGYGLSTLKYSPVLEHAQDVQALMYSLGHMKYKVLGTSGGGPYALALNYAASKKVVSGTVLMVPSAPREAPRDGASMSNFWWRKRIIWAPWFARITRLWTWDEFYLKMERDKELHPPKTYRNFKDGRKLLVEREKHNSSSAEGFIQDWRAVSRDWGFKLEDIDSKQILVFAGGLDVNTTLSSIRWMCKRLKNAKLVEEQVRDHSTMQDYTYKALEHLKRI